MAQCTTAVILAAGRGSRMQRHSSTVQLDAAQASAAARGMKAMIPDSRGRPFLDHVLSSLADAGITDVCVVIGPDHNLIRDHYRLSPPHRVAIAFAIQREAIGTADGLLAAEDWAAGRDFVVLNADNLYPVGAIRALTALDAPGLIAFERDALIRESNIDADRIGVFAVLTLDEGDTLVSIIEKPGADYLRTLAASPPISMNIWRFDAHIFSACRDVPPSPRGEYELPLAVAVAIERGMKFHAVRIAAGVLDLSSRGDIAEVARRLGDREIQP